MKIWQKKGWHSLLLLVQHQKCQNCFHFLLIAPPRPGNSSSCHIFSLNDLIFPHLFSSLLRGDGVKITFWMRISHLNIYLWYPVVDKHTVTVHTYLPKRSSAQIIDINYLIVSKTIYQANAKKSICSKILCCFFVLCSYCLGGFFNEKIPSRSPNSQIPCKSRLNRKNRNLKKI